MCCFPATVVGVMVSNAMSCTEKCVSHSVILRAGGVGIGLQIGGKETLSKRYFMQPLKRESWRYCK